MVFVLAPGPDRLYKVLVLRAGLDAIVSVVDDQKECARATSVCERPPLERTPSQMSSLKELRRVAACMVVAQS